MTSLTALTADKLHEIAHLVRDLALDTPEDLFDLDTSIGDVISTCAFFVLASPERYQDSPFFADVALTERLDAAWRRFEFGLRVARWQAAFGEPEKTRVKMWREDALLLSIAVRFVAEKESR